MTVIILNIFIYLFDQSVCVEFSSPLALPPHMDDFLSQPELCHLALTHNPTWTQLPPVQTMTLHSAWVPPHCADSHSPSQAALLHGGILKSLGLQPPVQE